MNPRVREQIFHEIAMGLGQGRDLKSLASSSLVTYLRKLGCKAGAVLSISPEGERQTVCMIPKKGGPRANRAMAMADQLQDRAVVSEHDHGTNFYAMILKGFGALVLVKKGEPFDHPILKSLEPINDKFAALCLACVHDEQLHKEIAAREKMEEELRRHKDELEDLVQARTRQLYESKAKLRQYVRDLRDANEKQEINSRRLSETLRELEKAHANLGEYNEELKKAMELREDIERITRHDLKTPLNFIIGAPGLLLDEANLTEDERSTVQLIQDSGYRMLDMINLSLDIYKMEQGLYRLNAEPVNLVPIMHRILQEARGMMSARSPAPVFTVHAQSAGEDDKFEVQGEPLLCYSLFSNLIKNAMEASPPEHSVTVSMDKDKGRARIRIHNQGAVPKGLRSTFFHKYVTSKQSGTGLGTYSAKLIVEAHDGQISMDTGERDGTTLTVLLSPA